MSNQVRLPGYDATDLDRLSYSNGVLVNDTTNKTIRLMDGETPGGFKFATQQYVQNNTITSGNLASNLAVALTPYAKTVDLVPYALTVDVNSAISAIPIYSLPTASTTVKGGVKPDGVTILVDANGVISGANQYVLPTAGVGVGGTKGGVKVDGTTITINSSTGIISGANTYVLPTASTTVKGGVKVDGTTILVDPVTGIISGANQYVLPASTTTVRGGVIIPAVATSGITNTGGTIGLAIAASTQIGGVKVLGSAVSGLYMLDGGIRLAQATTNQLGGVKVDGVTIQINGSGQIAANITGAIVFQGGWSAATNTPTLNNTSSAYNTNGYEFVTTASGTVNFGAGNVTFAVGDNVIYDGVKWVKIPIGSSAGTVNSLLTVNNAGTGDISGTQFNGSAPITISYNSVGASPLAGSSSLTTVGTIGTGTWNGGIIGATYGGTGVNNGANTLTISGGNRVLDQDVASASSPNFIGTNFSGTATNLTAGNATSATSATRATNLSGGAANQLHYQTGNNTSAFVTAASGTNTFLSWTGSAFTWTTVASATTATNLAGGAANRIHVQTGADTSGFIVAPTVASTFLTWTGTAFAFSTVAGATGGTVTSVGGTGTVSGITLTGTVTTNGNLTLGGALSLVSPGAIGSTTASTGAFTTLSANNRITSTFQATTADGGGSIFLNNATNNRIDFSTGGVAAPAFTTRSAGTKIVLWPGISAASGDYAIGIESNTQWFSVPATTSQFLWYGGTTVAATLSGAGAFTAVETRDTVYAAGATTGTIAPNAANGNVQTITLTGSITLNALTSPVTGQSLTLIIRQPATGGPFTLTSSMLFAGGFKTLSTANNAIDMVTISYIGTTYYASLVTGFA
jgi:hypothetical protein